MELPPALAEAAIIGPTSELIRRIEFYEANGTTPWASSVNDERLIEGTVNIDYSRDERRSVELTLDNTDFGLEHKPEALWYDKIIKVFCGVRFADNSPQIATKTRKNIFGNPTWKAGTVANTEVSRNFVPGGFNADSNADGVADGWSAYNSGTQGTVTRTATGGVQRLQATGLGNTTTDRVGIHFPITVMTGSATSLPKVVITGDFKAALATGQQIRIYIDFRDAANAIVGNFNQIFTSASGVNNSTFTTLITAASPAIPNTTTNALFYVWVEGAATGVVAATDITIDNLIVQFVYGTVAMARPFFDATTTGWTDGLSVAWVGTANASGTYLYGITNSNPTPFRYYQVQLSVSWKSDPLGVHRVLFQKDLASSLTMFANSPVAATITAGQFMSYRYQVRRVAGTGTCTLTSRVQFYTSGGSGLGGDATGTVTTMPADNSWQEVIVPALTVAPATASTGRPYITATGPEGTILEFKEAIGEIVAEAGMKAGMYFAGETLDFANRKFTWDGAVDLSTSTETITYTTQQLVIRNWEVQVGEFMIDQINEDHFPYVVKIQGRDYAKKCMLSKFSTATTFVNNTPIEDAIKAMAQNSGITKFILPLTGKKLGKDYMYERGVTRWEAMKEIATAFDQELFFNSEGYLTMRQFLDPTTSPIVYTFATGPLQGNLVSYSKSVNDNRIYNKIVVTGESSDATIIPVSAVATNTLSTSPTSIARIGERVYQYTSAFITTTAQAQSVANSFLKVHALEEFDLGFAAIALPWLEVGEIIEFLDPRASAGQPTRFLLSTINLPLSLGSMSGNAKRVSVVG